MFDSRKPVEKKSFLISQWWKIYFIIFCLSSLVCCIYISFFYYLLYFDLVFTPLCKKSFYNLIYTKKCKDRVLVIVKNQFKIVQWFKTITLLQPWHCLEVIIHRSYKNAQTYQWLHKHINSTYVLTANSQYIHT